MLITLTRESRKEVFNLIAKPTEKIPDNGDCAVLAFAAAYPGGEEQLREDINAELAEHNYVECTAEQSLRTVIATYCEKVLSNYDSFKEAAAADIYEFIIFFATAQGGARDTKSVKALGRFLDKNLPQENIYEVEQMKKTISENIDVICNFYSALATDTQEKTLQFSKNTIAQVAKFLDIPFIVIEEYNYDRWEFAFELFNIPENTACPEKFLFWKKSHVDIKSFEKANKFEEFYTRSSGFSCAPQPIKTMISVKDKRIKKSLEIINNFSQWLLTKASGFFYFKPLLEINVAENSMAFYVKDYIQCGKIHADLSISTSVRYIVNAIKEKILHENLLDKQQNNEPKLEIHHKIQIIYFLNSLYKNGDFDRKTILRAENNAEKQQLIMLVLGNPHNLEMEILADKLKPINQTVFLQICTELKEKLSTKEANRNALALA